MASKAARQLAFEHQAGLCYYCDHPMWTRDPESFAKHHGITRQASWLQCTAEHLVARSEGGTNSPDNIAAACRWCNRRRHARKQPMEPKAFRAHVRRRMSRGAWFPPRMRRLLKR